MCGGDSRDRTGQRRTMAETTAAPVRAMMRGRLCHPGFRGSAEAGDHRGPCRPRGSAAVARPEGPPGASGSEVSSSNARCCFALDRRTGKWARGVSEIRQPSCTAVRAVVSRRGRTVTCEAAKVKAKVCPNRLRVDGHCRSRARPPGRPDKAPQGPWKGRRGRRA